MKKLLIIISLVAMFATTGCVAERQIYAFNDGLWKGTISAITKVPDYLIP
jgi:hypothetical protein